MLSLKTRISLDFTFGTVARTMTNHKLHVLRSPVGFLCKDYIIREDPCLWRLPDIMLIVADMSF